jgi:hypothetical protein
MIVIHHEDTKATKVSGPYFEKKYRPNKRAAPTITITETLISSRLRHLAWSRFSNSRLAATCLGDLGFSPARTPISQSLDFLL